jgi:NAD(P)H-dependent FMN reductase
MNERNKLFIPILLGTNRAGRVTEGIANFLLGQAQARPDIETELFDVRNFRFPPDDYGEAIKDKDHNAAWRDAIVRADGLIIVSPEYNHGYPGVLKEALDMLFGEYNHKAVGVAGVSDGDWGGVRMVENLLPVLYDLGLVAVKPSLYFPNADKIFNEQGQPHDGGYVKRAGAFLDSLVWMARTLKWGRENV